MRKGVNKVIALGYLGADPETRRTPQGDCCASFSIATSESWKDKNTGEQKEVTEWIRCVAWRKLGEIVEQYVKKGSKIYIEGKLQTRSWEQDGSKRYATEVIVEELQMLDSKPAGDSKPKQNDYSNAKSGESKHKPSAPPADSGFDEDIPF